MSYQEKVVTFACGHDDLVGIITVPDSLRSSLGLVIVVGGPQYRVGGHRMFTLLARHVAAQGIPCLRFDYRGMGDSTGEVRTYSEIEADVRTAIDVLLRDLPSLTGVILWGLCDGASAACVHAPADTRIRGLILANPWVRMGASEAKVVLSHHYGRRLFDKMFWKKVLRGEASPVASFRVFLRSVRQARLGAARTTQEDEVAVGMASGVSAAAVPFALLLSERDRVAKVFEDHAFTGPAWAQASRALLLKSVKIDGADHTLSRREWLDQAAEHTVAWVNQIARGVRRTASWLYIAIGPALGELAALSPNLASHIPTLQ